MGLANKIAYKFATKMYSTFEQAAGLAKVEHVGAVTKVSDQKLLNQMNWWISKPTLIQNCQLYCLLVVLQELVSLTNW